MKDILYKVIAAASAVSLLSLTGCSQAEESSDVKSAADTSQTIESTAENNAESTEKPDS